MSYRPTISVYIDGHIADISCYRNWDDADLFFEAVAIAAVFADCSSISEYRFKKFGWEKVYYSLNPEIPEDSEENLKFLESCSENPIRIDLTEKCIFLSDETRGDAAGRISYKHINKKEILMMFRELKDLQAHLSAYTLKLVLSDDCDTGVECIRGTFPDTCRDF